ncbi:hypothetical protein MWU78_16085 [Arenibacter sp. F26102]|uniref:hypothetical protein n=1 Tax=Arenibacter sp. F26102 TaxID=2926416 RepID=UPI001FF40EFA|nr:hypothetical protein [Arenibacter sp. F26102]MCK0147178.1 hypothetical protein [Arenibacter sp. F26102]
MSSAEADLRLPFRHAPSKSFGFSFFFIISKAKSERFCDFINIDKTWDWTPGPHYFIGFVAKSFFFFRPSKSWRSACVLSASE